MSVTSPNMNIVTPVEGVDNGPQWATLLQNALYTTIDQHDHSSGKGIAIGTAGLSIQSSLSLNNNPLTAATMVTFTPVTTNTLSSAYVNGVDLWYNDGSGNKIKLTSNGSVAGTSGSIGGLTSPASASYSTGTFIWEATATTPASMDFGSAVLHNSGNRTYGLTLAAPTLSSSYSLVLPQVPGVASLLTIDTSGNMGTSPTSGFINTGGGQTITGTLAVNGNILGGTISSPSGGGLSLYTSADTNTGPNLTFTRGATSVGSVGAYANIIGGAAGNNDYVAAYTPQNAYFFSQNSYFFSGGSQTLLLDSLQNAVFSNTVTSNAVGQNALAVSSSSTNAVGLSTTNTSATGARTIIISEGSNGDTIANWANSSVFEGQPGTSGNTILDSFTGNLMLSTARTPALTINSSQNSTFAGNITVNGPGPSVFLNNLDIKASNSLLLFNANNTAYSQIYSAGSGGGNNTFTINTNVNNAFTLDASGNGSFVGSLSAASFSGSGSGLTNIPGAQINSASIPGSSIASATITGSNIAATTIAASNIVNNTITNTQISTSTLNFGTYSPSVQSSTHCTATPQGSWIYSRVGNTCTVSGQVAMSGLSSGWSFTVSLPLGNTFSSGTQASGTATTSTATAAITSSSGNAAVLFNGNATSDQTYSFIFLYQIQ